MTSPLVIRKWYFAFNHNAVGSYERMIRVAVLSNRRCAGLAAHCVYCGPDVPLLDWLEENGVTVIRHEGSLRPTILRTPAVGHFHPAVAEGAYLRLDIPLLEATDEFVLYTDLDVLFLGDPGDWGDPPRFFSCAPEFWTDDWSYCNTGVMIMNVPALRAEHEKLIAFAADNLLTHMERNQGVFDQKTMNLYFGGRWDRLPLGLNWKPYWGVNPEARILHFHGPKPPNMERIFKGDTTEPQVYRDLVDRDRRAALYYLRCFHLIERSAPRTRPA
jgi:hypothetical protein